MNKTEISCSKIHFITVLRLSDLQIWHGDLINQLVNRSTNEHITKFNEFIKDALDNKRILTAVFVDFESAHDSVWRKNLLLKLVRSGIRSKLIQWLELFISHRACKVRQGEYYSKYHILHTGLPQGAATSCTLFNLYINELIGELYSIPGIKCLLRGLEL